MKAAHLMASAARLHWFFEGSEADSIIPTRKEDSFATVQICADLPFAMRQRHQKIQVTLDDADEIYNDHLAELLDSGYPAV